MKLPDMGLPKISRDSTKTSPPPHIGRTLFHGTPSLENARDILKKNRFKAKNCSPSGVWTSSNFNTAKGYAFSNGFVVKINNNIDSNFCIDMEDVFSDPRFKAWKMQNGNSGDSQSKFVIEVLNKRIVREKRNVFIAVTPVTNNNEYYRIEGFLPVAILDKNGNIVEDLNTIGGSHV